MNAKKIKKQLRLAEEPDAELLALLDGIEDRPAKTTQVNFQTIIPQAIQATLEDELISQSVSQLITHARKKRGLTLEQIGQIMKVGKGRMSQIEKAGANLELQTLARVAQALEYDLKVSFVSRQNDLEILEQQVSSFG
jgi:DNA-directed RNA polymerase specialized sigma subunit